MKLKEFEFDLPYVANEKVILNIMQQENISQKEATIKDYQLNWKWKRKNFINETKCISSHLERIQPSIENKYGTKILIECVPEIKNYEYINLTGMLVVQVKFNFETYSRLSAIDKQLMIFVKLQEGIHRVCEQIGIEYQKFKLSLEVIEFEQFANVWIWKSIKYKKSKIFVEVDHQIDKIDFYFVIDDGENQEKFHFMTTGTHELDYTYKLGKLIKDENKIMLLGKKGEQIAELNLNNKHVRILTI